MNDCELELLPEQAEKDDKVPIVEIVESEAKDRVATKPEEKVEALYQKNQTLNVMPMKILNYRYIVLDNRNLTL